MRRPLALFLPFALAVAACGGNPGATSSPSPPPASVAAPTDTASLPASEPAASEPAASEPAASQPAGESVAVEIVDFGYREDDITVPVGTTVAWTNTGGAPHTVTFDNGPDSGRLANGEVYDRTFQRDGEFSYFCALHPQMTGTVTVEG
jgi:plastocyanin